MHIYSIEKARPRLGHIVNEAEAGEPSTITHYGHPVAVVVSYEWWKKASALLGTPRSHDSGRAREDHSAS